MRLCVLISPFYKDVSHTGLEAPSSRTQSSLITSATTLSPTKVTFPINLNQQHFVMQISTSFREAAGGNIILILLIITASNKALAVSLALSHHLTTLSLCWPMKEGYRLTIIQRLQETGLAQFTLLAGARAGTQRQSSSILIPREEPWPSASRYAAGNQERRRSGIRASQL